jgi:polysaccharide pyruvyl transferase WcaK-like protein
MSYYYHEDQKLRIPDKVMLVNAEPKTVLWNSILSCWVFLAVRLHLPKCFWGFGLFKTVSGADVWLDAAGISFVDGREKFTFFNILSLLPAFSLKIPVVKVSQAMGPFHNFLNRLFATLFLSKFRTIVARGDVTFGYLKERNLSNLVLHSDSALFLKYTEQNVNEAKRLLPEEFSGKMIGISPSQVVYQFCKKQNIPYLEVLKKAVTELSEEGYHCVIFPHSARQGKTATHNNDLPVLDVFCQTLGPDTLSQCTIIKEELSPGTLRALIAECSILIASRFHAIISAMATGTPTVVIGWSHKYAEVLEQFEVSDFVIPYGELSIEVLHQKTNNLLANREAISTKIMESFEAIKERDSVFFDNMITDLESYKHKAE